MTEQRTIAIPGSMHVGPDCLPDLDRLLAEFDRTKVLIGSGDGPSLEFAQRVVEGLRRAGTPVIHESGLRGRLDQAAELAARVISEDVTLLVAVGGGRVIDTVKLAAARTSTPFASAPTTLSHDGISSPVASLLAKDGRRKSFAASMPDAVVVDLEVIATAPETTLKAGAGDLISNLTAIRDWQLADRRGRDTYDAFAAMIAETAALPLLHLDDIHNRAAQELLAKGLLLSGLAMAAAGTSRPCSGAEHLISHSLDARAEAVTSMHGEQVAVATLFSAAAHDEALLASLKELYRRIGLPRGPEDLRVTRDELLAAIQESPGTRPERYTILTELTRAGGGRIEELAGRAFG